MITTGDKIPATSLAQLPELFPNARIFNVYGCTETNDSMMHEFDLTAGEPPAKVPIGKPIQGVEARVEGEDGGPLEGAGTGELLVRTPFQTRGYLTSRGTRGRSSRAATTARVSGPTTAPATSSAATRRASSRSRAAATST